MRKTHQIPEILQYRSRLDLAEPYFEICGIRHIFEKQQYVGHISHLSKIISNLPMNERYYILRQTGPFS